MCILMSRYYFDIFRTYEDNTEEAIKQCQVLLEESSIEQAVRIGDVYGLMVEHYARKEKWKVVRILWIYILVGTVITTFIFGISFTMP